MRKVLLTAHVVASVGWLGSVAAFLALAIAGLNSREARPLYLAMEVIAWSVIVPLCLASLSTGIVQSVVTPWGLFRHYWVAMKLGITVLATILLFLHLGPITRAADDPSPSALRTQLAVDAGAALVALLVNTALSIYKPRGLTRYGRRKQRAA